MTNPKLFTQAGPGFKKNHPSTRSHRLSDLLDMSSMQKLADANYEIAGFPISILDAFDGTVLVASGWQDICTKFHRLNPLSNAQCISGNIEIRKQFATNEIHK